MSRPSAAKQRRTNKQKESIKATPEQVAQAIFAPVRRKREQLVEKDKRAKPRS